jgi:hypothetical protein
VGAELVVVLGGERFEGKVPAEAFDGEGGNGIADVFGGE